MPTVNLLKKLHKQALAIDDRSRDEASESPRQIDDRHKTGLLFISSLLVENKNGRNVLREDTPADSTAKDPAPCQKTLGASLSLIPRLLRSDFSTRNASEDQCIRYCIAPNAVRTVDAAGDFARRVEAFNRLAVDVHHLRLGVDLQTAHRMVNRRRHDRRPVRAFIQTVLGKAGAAAELVALLYLAELIPRGNRLLEILGVDAGGLGEIVKRLVPDRVVLLSHGHIGAKLIRSGRYATSLSRRPSRRYHDNNFTANLPDGGLIRSASVKPPRLRSHPFSSHICHIYPSDLSSYRT